MPHVYVALNAVQDINNNGRCIDAQNSLTALAGREINVTSTTQSSAGNNGRYSYRQSGIERVATLYQALMDSSLAFAKAQNLRPGIARPPRRLQR